MLKIKNLHAQLEEQKILNGIDLTVNPGEIHVILGPNGSGKSTLGRVILGDDRYEVPNGSIEFNGSDFTELEPSERAQAGYFLSFQSPPEIDGVSVREFLFAAKKSTDPEFSSSYKFKKGLKETFTDLRLPEDFTERETNLGFSGGERKKAEVAAMLTLDPKLAFLDEIDSGVDIDTIREIGSQLRTFTEDKSKSLIIVSHSDKLLQEIKPTHVHVFLDGKVVETGGHELVEKIQSEGFDGYKNAKQEIKGFGVIN